jgi:adenylate cyclase
MAPDSFKRKLIAILSADVKDYSRLMGEDEEGTIRILNAYMEVIAGFIQQHRGRVVATGGDSVLAEFSSVVDAVRCAVGIQEELKDRNKELPEGRRMEFRIGVNLGDVVEEGDNILGDGVNVAARVQSLAEAGGISISGTAYDQIRNKLAFGYEFLGEQTVKNIKEPVRVYRVRMDPEVSSAKSEEEKKSTRKGLSKAALAIMVTILVIAGGAILYQFALRPSPSKIEVASKEKMAFPLPDKPSIAVLPFVNMSGDPKEEYLSDGITEQIINGLSKIPKLFVIARNSTFVYKGKPVKIQKVAEDLGVRYVLEGSVQRSGNRLRVTAQLIDAITGHHMWSEQYDRELTNMFALQDEITMRIMGAARVELTEGEQARQWGRKGRTDNLQALEKYLQGLDLFFRNTKQDNDTARQLFEEAIALDPNFIWPYVHLGFSHWTAARFGWSESPAKSLQVAFELAQKALAMDGSIDKAHSLLAASYLVMRQHDKALSEAEQAVALNPNGADAYLILAGIVGCSGRWEESVLYVKKSIRLNPIPITGQYWVLGRAYFMMGQYDEAILTLKKTPQINPDFLPAHIYLAECYSSIGRDAEAAAAIKEVLRINPKFSIESYAKTLPYKNKADVEREVAALQKAGLK